MWDSLAFSGLRPDGLASRATPPFFVAETFSTETEKHRPRREGDNVDDM